jgi:hypothetical protein
MLIPSDFRRRLWDVFTLWLSATMGSRRGKFCSIP